MTDFAKLVLDADTTGLKKGEAALKETTKAATETAKAADQVTESTTRLGMNATKTAENLRTTAASSTSLGREAKVAAVDVAVMSQATQEATVQSQKLGVSVGQQRAGMQQLGYQLNDVATMYSLGAKPAQIFGSQIGQITQAVQLMTGGTSRFAAFLGGPWGIALSVGVVALTPFIAKLWETYGAANAATGALQALIEKERQRAKEQRVLRDSEKDLNQLLTRRKQLEDEIAQRGVRNPANGQLQFVFRQQQELREINRQIAEGRGAVDQERASRAGLGSLPDAMKGIGVSAPAAAQGMSAVGSSIRAANDNAKSFTDSLQSANDALADMRKSMQAAGIFTGNAGDAMRKVRADDGPVQQDMARLNGALTELQQKTEETRKRTERGNQGIADSFRNMASDALNALDRLAGGIESGNFLSILSGVLDLGLNLAGLGAFGKSVQTKVTSLPGRANGGNVSAGQPYIVGENRPEVFIPDTNGRIQPSLGQGGGQVVVINNSALADVFVDGRIQASAPAIVTASADYTQSQMARRSTRRVA